MARSGRGGPQCRFSAAALAVGGPDRGRSRWHRRRRGRRPRRAFLVGIERYSDGFIQRLDRTVNDAKDVAKDLEEVGFDKKNIKVVTDLKNRDAFEKEFSAFLKTVESGDTVVFFFSGHGFGVEADQTNYLLFTDLKSPFTFTKTQLTDQERKNADIVRLRIPVLSRCLSAERNSQRHLGDRGAETAGGAQSQDRHHDPGCLPLAGRRRPERCAGCQARSSAATIPAAGC